MTDAFDRLKMQLIDLLAASLNGTKIALPEAGQLLWTWFMDLNASRSWHMNGPNPISYQEIESYCRVTGWPIRPHEVKAIRELDQAYTDHFYSKRESGAANLQTLPRSSGSAINPAVFDAVFG